MAIPSEPQIISGPLGYEAQSGEVSQIPETTPEGDGIPSVKTLFPEITALNPAAGGKMIERSWVNGLFNLIGQHLFWHQTGKPYVWKNTLDYPKGAKVTASDGETYVALIDNGPNVAGGAKNPTTTTGVWVRPVLKNQLLNLVYPVGSIYMSVNNASPATLFGGTWQKLEGCFLLGSSASHANGSTGGSETVTLTTSQIPAHDHGGTTGSAGAHTPAGKITGGSHSHGASTAKNGSHSHTRGNMNITGTFRSVDMGGREQATGAFRDAAVTGAVNPASGSAGLDTVVTMNAANSGAWTGATSSAGEHTHTVTVNNATPSMTFTGTAVGNHSHTISSQGGGGSHDNMPPYLTVNIWKRTA